MSALLTALAYTLAIITTLSLAALVLAIWIDWTRDEEDPS